MRKAALIWIGLIGGATSAAVADTSQDCAQNRDRNLIILACSEIIGHGGNVAWAYYNRGNAHRAKGENDRAIADYTMAIEINPKHANAFNSRGRQRRIFRPQSHHRLSWDLPTCAQAS